MNVHNYNIMLNANANSTLKRCVYKEHAVLLFLIFNSISINHRYLPNTSNRQQAALQNVMKSTAIVAILCPIIAMGMALSPSQVARSESEVLAQWHLRAPARGCVQVVHYVGGSYFRTYACDDNDSEFLATI